MSPYKYYGKGPFGKIATMNGVDFYARESPMARHRGLSNPPRLIAKHTYGENVNAQGIDGLARATYLAMLEKISNDKRVMYAHGESRIMIVPSSLEEAAAATTYFACNRNRTYFGIDVAELTNGTYPEIMPETKFELVALAMPVAFSIVRLTSRSSQARSSKRFLR